MAEEQRKQQLRKVTVMLPSELLASATAATGKGITPTIRLSLERIAAGQAFEALRRMRGKVRLSIDVDSLREDRK